MSWNAGLVVAFALLACSLGKPSADIKARVENAKVSASVSEYDPRRIDLRGPGKSVSLSGLGPYGAFDVRFNGKIGPTPGEKPELAASPDGEMLAFRSSAGQKWIVFYLTPRRKALDSDYEYRAGALASETRAQPAGPSVDWTKVPSLLEVAPDIAREGHPYNYEDYYTDVFGEVFRRGGESALQVLLAKTSDVTGAETKYSYVKEEVCGGKSAWLLAYRALPSASREPVVAALEKNLARSKLDAEVVLRAGLALPLENKALAPTLAARVRDLFGTDNEMADVGRGILLRRLVFLDSDLAADVACEFVGRRYAIAPLKRPFADATEAAALLAIAFAKRACPAVASEPSETTEPPSDVSIADEAKDTMDPLRRRAGRCETPSPFPSAYLYFAKRVQPNK